MRVEDFSRPKNDNRRGVHWTASIYHLQGTALDPWIAELRALHIKWVKLLDDGGGSSLELCGRLLAADIMPIVRLYRHEPNPGHVGGRETDTLKRLIAAGVRYFETNNEPDLALEWDGRVMPENWLDVVIDNFIIDADTVLGLGGYPAFPAMGVGSKVNPFAKVVDRGRADLFEKGAWIAIHNYTLNHPLDYPYDAVNQLGTALSSDEYARAGAWAWDGQAADLISQWRASDKNPGDTVADDPCCFLAFRLTDELVTQTLGHKVPIISTEGGPLMGNRDDRRYPRISAQMHADWITTINDFMQGNREIQGASCPSNYFAMCHWLLGNYRLGFFDVTWESQSWYTDWWNTTFDLAGQLPVVDAVKNMPSIVVDEPVWGTVTGYVLQTGTEKPLANIRVQLRSADYVVATTATGTDGSFKFTEVPLGTYDLDVGSWGILRSDIVVTAEASGPLVIHLAGYGKSAIYGSILDYTHTALAGVQVTLIEDAAVVGQTTTATDGTFEFQNLSAGIYRVTVPGITIAGVALDGWAGKTLRLVTGASSGMRYVVTQRRLLPADETANRSMFYGTVMDAAGTPLNGIKVQMSWHDAETGTTFPTTVTGKDPYKAAGTYEFVHTQGVFRLDVVEGDWPADPADDLDTAKVAGREGQPITYEVDFQRQLLETTGSIEGQVSGGTAGSTITLKKLDSGETHTMALGDDGTFAFVTVPMGSYTLEMANVGVIASDITLEAGGQFTLLFPMRSQISGQALGASGGTVAVLRPPAPWTWVRQAPLQPDGNFAFSGLPAGRYRLQVADYVLPDLVLTGENSLTLVPFDLRKGRRSVVRGRVVDNAGRPQPDVVMILRQGSDVLARTTTVDDGTYRFGNLPAGTYSLEAEGVGVVAADIVLDGENEKVQDVLWVGPASNSVVQGRVVGDDGKPLPGVPVQLMQDDVAVSVTVTEESGAYRFSALATGVYALAAGTRAPLVAGLPVGHGAAVVRDLVLPKPARPIAHYLLFARPSADGSALDETRLALALALPYLRQTGAAAGFLPEEACHAAEVLIVGDRVPAEVEGMLRAAGCRVSRLAGDSAALAETLRRLSAAAGQG